MEQEPLLRVEGLKKVFRSGESDLVLFENLSFEVKRGEMLAIVGESGAGKSTLLHILSALDRASAGDVYCANLQLNRLSLDDEGRPALLSATLLRITFDLAKLVEWDLLQWFLSNSFGICGRKQCIRIRPLSVS